MFKNHHVYIQLFTLHCIHIMLEFMFDGKSISKLDVDAMLSDTAVHPLFLCLLLILFCCGRTLFFICPNVLSETFICNDSACQSVFVVISVFLMCLRWVGLLLVRSLFYFSLFTFTNQRHWLFQGFGGWLLIFSCVPFFMFSVVCLFKSCGGILLSGGLLVWMLVESLHCLISKAQFCRIKTVVKHAMDPDQFVEESKKTEHI